MTNTIINRFVTVSLYFVNTSAGRPGALTSRALPSGGLGSVPGPHQQDSSGVSGQNVSSVQEDQALNKLRLLVFLRRHKKRGQKENWDHWDQ